MDIFKSWKFWVIVYLISAVIFAQSFKKSNRNMKNASLLTILLELFTAFFSIFFIPFFEFTLPTDISIYLILLIVIIIYAFTDRLNIEARYGLDPSVFSFCKKEYKVVDLPVPVAPVTKIIPLGKPSILRTLL